MSHFDSLYVNLWVQLSFLGRVYKTEQLKVVNKLEVQKKQKTVCFPKFTVPENQKMILILKIKFTPRRTLAPD